VAALGLTDPTGAAFCLWTSADGDVPGDVPPGGFERAVDPGCEDGARFYERAFGYTHESMDMGEQGQYHILKSANGRKPRRPVLWQPTRVWLPYVHVADRRQRRQGAGPGRAADLFPADGCRASGASPR
jgi:hypothetical protein